MANKWRVAFGERVLGHYAAKTPEEAVEKGIDKWSDLYQMTGVYTVTKAGNANNEIFEVVR